MQTGIHLPESPSKLSRCDLDVISATCAVPTCICTHSTYIGNETRVRICLPGLGYHPVATRSHPYVTLHAFEVNYFMRLSSYQIHAFLPTHASNKLLKRSHCCRMRAQAALMYNSSRPPYNSSPLVFRSLDSVFLCTLLTLPTG